MTVAQKKKILTRIVQLEKDIEELKRVRSELATFGYSSASISTTGGSRSYTRLDLSKVTIAIGELRKELAQCNNMLSLGSASPFRTISVVYS